MQDHQDPPPAQGGGLTLLSSCRSLLLCTTGPDSAEARCVPTVPVLEQVADVPVVNDQRRWSSLCSFLWSPQLQSIAKVVDIPFVVQRQFPMIHTFQVTSRPWNTFKLNILGDDLQCFLRAPGIWQSLVQCLPRPKHTGKLNY